VNDKKIKFLREGLEQVLADIIKHMDDTDTPTLVGIGTGVVYIPKGDRGLPQVVTGYRTDEEFAHQDADVLRDVGESFLAQSGVVVMDIKPERGN
jgi:hypothetical protein